MPERRARGTLRVRLVAAFAAVAAAAIAAFAGLTLWAGRGDVASLVRRQQQATAVSVAAAAAEGWATGDLRAARAVALGAGAALEVHDAHGALLLQAARGLGPAWMRPQAALPSYGAARTLPVVVGGTRVGSVELRFPSDALPPAERQLRDALTRTTLYGAAIAAGVALLAGLLVADGITRPLRRLIETVRRVGAGERGARANLAAAGELGELGAAFDAMAGALQREDELRRSLTADVAHELRTPVTILTAQCEALVDGLAAPSPAQLASLHDEALRLGRAIEDLETLASAEAAGLQLERAPVRLDQVAGDAAERLRPQFAAAGVELATRLRPTTVTGDELRLGQVVRNLLTNALKFTPTGGRVAVEVEDGVLAVADSGIGISDADLPHVFDRFWRGANGRAAAGSGIGLAVVDELVRAHGGTVEAVSAGGGTTFTVRLEPARERAASI